MKQRKQYQQARKLAKMPDEQPTNRYIQSYLRGWHAVGTKQGTKKGDLK